MEPAYLPLKIVICNGARHEIDKVKSDTNKIVF